MRNLTHHISFAAAALTVAACGLALATEDRMVDLERPGQTEIQEQLLVRARDAVEVLSSGTPKERFDVAENAAFHFEPLSAAEGAPDDPRVVKLREALIRFIRAEPDDRITALLLSRLQNVSHEFLLPLFLEALRHHSPNVRLQGIRQYAEGKWDPEARSRLESLWETEDRPWIRAELVGALAQQGSRKSVVELISLARGSDRRLAAAAIHALSLLGVEEAIPTVAPLALTGSPRIRLEAIEFLSHWPDSDDTEEALLDASHSDVAGERTAAAIALGFPSDDRAAERLVELADGDREASVRGMARYTFLLRSNPRRSGILRQALQNLTMTAEREDEEAVRVVPPASWGSVRCWRAPGLAGAPDQLPRLGSGTSDSIDDRFEWAGDMWVHISPDKRPGGCWVPGTQLAEDPASPNERGEPAPSQVELDIGTEELSSREAGALLASGMLEILDPADVVVGVRLVLDPRDPAALEVLLRAYGYRGTLLDRMIVQVAGGARARCDGDPRLEPLLKEIQEDASKRQQRDGDAGGAGDEDDAGDE